jgi:hypothetical protein
MYDERRSLSSDVRRGAGVSKNVESIERVRRPNRRKRNTPRNMNCVKLNGEDGIRRKADDSYVETSNNLRAVRSDVYAGYLFAGKKQPLIHTRVCRLLRFRIDLRFYTGGLAVRHRGSNLGSRGGSALANHHHSREMKYLRFANENYSNRFVASDARTRTAANDRHSRYPCRLSDDAHRSIGTERAW